MASSSSSAVNEGVVKKILLSYSYVAIWIMLSFAVIVYNKYILDPKMYNWPFPISLTMIHMAFSSSLAFFLVRVARLVEPPSSPPMSRDLYLSSVVPIGALFSLSLWFSNSAYIYLSVSFIQMLKALMPVAVYSIGVSLNKETFRSSSMANMLSISFGVAVAAYGEAHFDAWGVTLQLAAVAFEATRLVLIQILLTSKGISLNPITSLYYVAPCCLLFLLVPWIVIELPILKNTSSFHFGLNWLNLEMKKIWPYVNEAASELIRTSVEPTLEQYRTPMLASLKFSTLTLGTVAPQFTGVAIIEDDDSSGITMELEIQWDGNPNIVLDVKTKFGVALPIQVKNIGFTGVFRLIFKPLVEEFPCFGAVSYSLREKKNLDFTLKVIGGELLSLPGIADAIEDTIHNAIEDSITWPVRNIVPILPGDYSDLELKPAGMLEVKLIQAKELTNKDVVGKSDPFAVVYIRPLPDRMKTSKTINNDLNPIWNEHFEFIVEDPSTQRLIVKIYDDEGVQAAELIGMAQVWLNELQPGKVKDVWLKLVKDLEIQRDRKNRGQVHLELLYCPYGTESELTNPFADHKFSLTSLEKALKNEVGETGTAEIDRTSTLKKKDVIIRGVLTVTIIAAEELPVMDVMGKADPFVVITLKKTETRNKTRVLHDTLNPVWNQTFDIVVEDGLHDMLILEVWDHDTFGKNFIGRCIMTLTRVILEGEVKEGFPLEGAKSGKLFVHLKWTPQPIYRDP